MTSHLDSHRTNDIKPEMLSGVKTGNGTPHDKYNIRGISHVRTNGKEDIFMQRRLVQSFTYILELGRGTCTLTKHTRRWTYSALRHFQYRQPPGKLFRPSINETLIYICPQNLNINTATHHCVVGALPV